MINRSEEVWNLPVQLSTLAQREMRMLAGCTPCFFAISVTIGLVSKGELSEPNGEYAVMTIPFSLQS